MIATSTHLPSKYKSILVVDALTTMPSSTETTSLWNQGAATPPSGDGSHLLEEYGSIGVTLVENADHEPVLQHDVSDNPPNYAEKEIVITRYALQLLFTKISYRF